MAGTEERDDAGLLSRSPPSITILITTVCLAGFLRTWDLAPQDMKLVFDSIDADHNGQLSPQELVNCLSDLGWDRVITAMHITRLFERFDSNHSGELSYEQFAAGIQAYEDKLRAVGRQLWPDGTTHVDGAAVRKVLVDPKYQLLANMHGTALEAADLEHLMTQITRTAVHPDQITCTDFMHILFPLTRVLHQDFATGNYHSVSVPVPVSTTKTQTFVAGMVAGLVSRTVTAPMDRLRAKMAAGVPGKRAPGMVEISRNILSKGGVRAFWTGNGANCIQVGPESALLFLLNDVFKPYIAKDPLQMSVQERFACGAAAGAMAMTMVYPMYVVQNRLLVAPSGFYTGIADVFRKTHADGIKAFGGGYGVSLIRIIPYKGIDMAGYSMLRDYFCPDVSQTVTHPLLVVRTRLQCQGFAGRPIEYSGMVDAFSKTWKTGGMRALFGGWVPSMAKNVPAIAVQFAVCERLLSEFRNRHLLA